MSRWESGDGVARGFTNRPRPTWGFAATGQAGNYRGAGSGLRESCAHCRADSPGGSSQGRRGSHFQQSSTNYRVAVQVSHPQPGQDICTNSACPSRCPRPGRPDDGSMDRLSSGPTFPQVEALFSLSVSIASMKTNSYAFTSPLSLTPPRRSSRKGLCSVFIETFGSIESAQVGLTAPSSPASRRASGPSPGRTHFLLI